MQKVNIMTYQFDQIFGNTCLRENLKIRDDSLITKSINKCYVQCIAWMCVLGQVGVLNLDYRIKNCHFPTFKGEVKLKINILILKTI